MTLPPRRPRAQPFAEGARCPPLPFLFSKGPHPAHPPLSHVVFVVTAPTFNEVRLLVNHHVIGSPSAGGGVYLALTACAAQP